MLNYRTLLYVGLLSVLLLVSGAPNAHAIKPIERITNTSQNSALIYISNEIDHERAKQTVQSMGEKAIGFLGDSGLSLAQKERAFKEILTNNFDMKTIGRFALGKNWRIATAAEKEEYQRLFEQAAIRIYSSRFGEYQGEGFIVEKVRANGKKDALVTSYIVSKAGAKFQVDWRLRVKKDGSYKIIDILVEGVSMSLTQRSEFASIIQRGGGKISVLLDHLRK